MGLFGEYLVERGAITPLQLEETVRSQVVYGGRIGTSLLERGFLRLEDLADHLSRYHGFPLPPAEWLESPDARAIKLVPLPLIRRCKLLPLRLDETTLHVALQDPTNEEQLELLAVASERSITAYVLPEVRLAYWLERHHNVDRHPRLVQLASRAREIGMSEEEPQPATPIASRHDPATRERTDVKGPSLAASPGALGQDASQDDEIILLEEIFAEPDPLPEFEFPATQPPPQPEPVSIDVRMSSTRIASLEQQLHAATERDEIVRLALEIARSYSRAAALFLVRGGVVSGYRGDGDGMSRDLAGINIPIGTASIFTHPTLTLTPFRGEPPEDGIDGRLLDVLGRGSVREVVIMPIGLDDRVINLLYADNGSDGFGETSIAALTALCEGLAGVYQRAILAKKKRA